MTVIRELRRQIQTSQIIFDTGKPELKDELLGENTGTKVTANLQILVLELSKLQKIRISSLIRGSTTSNHGLGKAVDIGNESVAENLLSVIANDLKVSELKIDEIIFDAKIANSSYDRNRWNYDQGSKHTYDNTTLDGHKDHIHFAVTQ